MISTVTSQYKLRNNSLALQSHYESIPATNHVDFEVEFYSWVFMTPIHWSKTEFGNKYINSDAQVALIKKKVQEHEGG